MSNREENFFSKRFEEMQEQNLLTQNSISSKKIVKPLITSVVAVLLAGVTAVTCFIGVKKKKDDTNINTTELISDVSEVSLDELGVELDVNKKQDNKQYGSTTGNVDKNKLVEKDGTLYVDKDAADKSNEIGKVTIDDNNGKYEITDGNVVDKDIGYEIQDENGNIIDSGSSNGDLPDGYVKDEEIDKVVKEEDAGKFITVDADYYDQNGVLIFSKGEVVLKETFERIKKDSNLTTNKAEESTTKTEETTTTTEPTTVVVEHGVVNSDGTYTIYGVTYKSKSDYEQFLLHPEQYGMYNGMVLSLEDIEALFQENQKTR